MSVFTCLEVAWLDHNYCLQAGSDTLWYAATPSKHYWHSFTKPFPWKKPSYNLVFFSIKKKKPGWNCHTLVRNVCFFYLLPLLWRSYVTWGAAEYVSWIVIGFLCQIKNYFLIFLATKFGMFLNANFNEWWKWYLNFAFYPKIRILSIFPSVWERW